MIVARNHPRVDFFSPVKVLLPDKNVSVDTFACNISQGGVFLRSSRPLPAGTRVALKFDTQQGPVEVTDGEVIWAKKFEPINVDGTVPGMGIQFKYVPASSKLLIGSLVTHNLQSDQPEPVADIKNIPCQTDDSVSQLRIQPARPNEDLSPSIIKYRRQNRVLMFTTAVLGVGVITWMILSTLLQPGSKPPTDRPAVQTEPKHEPRLAQAGPPVAARTEEAILPKLPTPTETKLAGKSNSPTSGLNIDLPTFLETADGWQMLLRIDPTARFKYFSLDDPARLVVDLIDCKFVGSRNFIKSPTPFIRALRIGRRDGYVRLVLDFGTGERPVHSLKKTAEGLKIHFKQ
ncbi:MAG: PilZ domain-containing protein [Deltaproteobacteria bacterium]|nr:PilZ domain-containing protein [Deltaproteobacteria bacterium]MBW1872495.1 PilZ domain-containing protein [Deltaproteobacteria bacterium]